MLETDEIRPDKAVLHGRRRGASWLRQSLIAMAVAASLVAAPGAAVDASVGDHSQPAERSGRSAQRSTVAVIGDVPYGTAQEAQVSTLIDAVNADPKVRLVVHVGDIKSGSTECSDERFASVAAAFATFRDPLVYTPGDNEWTDCHRANNGTYHPLERLAALRAQFFTEPGETLGRRPRRVLHQPQLVENVRWIDSHVAFATLHVVGSNNGMAPWTGLGNTAIVTGQAAEVQARTSAVLAWIDATFDVAERRGLRGVVLAMQADTWDPAPTSAQQVIVDRITARAERFDGEVLLLQGDSHVFKADEPLALDNLTRIVVHGETLPFEYLRLTIDPRDPQLFSWERVPVEQ